MTEQPETANFPSPTQSERIADFWVHAIGLLGLVIACAILMGRVFERGEAAEIVAIVVYATGALGSIGVSFAYHLLSRHEWRARLRRWDHAAIYVAIAGAFSPLLVASGTASALAILGIVWMFAVLGVWFKLSGDNADSRWSLISYMALGAFGLIALPDFWTQLPRVSTWAILAGASSYTVGTVFYRNKGMRFRYPVWHAFGTLGGSCFFVAVWMAITG